MVFTPTNNHPLISMVCTPTYLLQLHIICVVLLCFHPLTGYLWLHSIRANTAEHKLLQMPDRHVYTNPMLIQATVHNKHKVCIKPQIGHSYLMWNNPNLHFSSSCRYHNSRYQCSICGTHGSSPLLYANYQSIHQTWHGSDPFPFLKYAPSWSAVTNVMLTEISLRVSFY